MMGSPQPSPPPPQSYSFSSFIFRLLLLGKCHWGEEECFGFCLCFSPSIWQQICPQVESVLPMPLAGEGTPRLYLGPRTSHVISSPCPVEEVEWERLGRCLAAGQPTQQLRKMSQILKQQGTLH